MGPRFRRFRVWGGGGGFGWFGVDMILGGLNAHTPETLHMIVGGVEKGDLLYRPFQAVVCCGFEVEWLRSFRGLASAEAIPTQHPQP